MNKIITEIRKELIENSSKDAKIALKKFFKNDIKSYGVKTPVVVKISKKYYKEILSIDKKEIFNLCEELWKSGYIEESFIACNLSYFIHDKYKQEDFEIFEKWVDNYVSNWASCDTLCNHTIGTFIEMYPEYLKNLKVWAKSDNLWKRRASAVSLIVPSRRGKFLKEIFSIADNLLIDEDDLVQKGYGWMLKATSEAHQKEVFDYVMKNKNKMPRTALRYAIEKMPRDLKNKAMEK